VQKLVHVIFSDKFVRLALQASLVQVWPHLVNQLKK